MTKGAGIAAIMFIALTTPSNAATIRGAGMATCNDWMRAQEGQQKIVDSWVMGFVSGYELQALPEYTEGSSEWENSRVLNILMTWCQAHPTERVVDGAEQAIGYMVDHIRKAKIKSQ
jgi:hypothetical protein